MKTKIENFLQQEDWKTNDKGMFDYNGLFDLLNKYEQHKNTFDNLSEEILKYLNANHHPHTILIAENNSVQVFEGVKSTGYIDKFIKD